MRNAKKDTREADPESWLVAFVNLNDAMQLCMGEIFSVL